MFVARRTYQRGLAKELREAKDQCGAVMVIMQQFEWFLLKDHKHGIGKLPVFHEVV